MIKIRTKSQHERNTVLKIEDRDIKIALITDNYTAISPS